VTYPNENYGVSHITSNVSNSGRCDDLLGRGIFSLLQRKWRFMCWKMLTFILILCTKFLLCKERVYLTTHSPLLALKSIKLFDSFSVTQTFFENYDSGNEIVLQICSLARKFIRRGILWGLSNQNNIMCTLVCTNRV
jgi:hypothetical protein